MSKKALKADIKAALREWVRDHLYTDGYGPRDEIVDGVDQNPDLAARLVRSWMKEV